MKNKVTGNPSKPPEPEDDLLARVYAFILNIPDPPTKETTGSDHFSENTEPAEETTANDADAL